MVTWQYSAILIFYKKLGPALSASYEVHRRLSKRGILDDAPAL